MSGETVTTLLDAIGLALLAAGAGAAAFALVGWACLAVAGVVLLVGSWAAGKLGERR